MTAEKKRASSRKRKTGETEVEVAIDLDGGEVECSTGIGFFDHMLDALGRHSGTGLRVIASGDLETGSHHTVEDAGIVIGQALDEALGERSGIRRFGWSLAPMDEALAECAIDLSGRGLLVFEADIPVTEIGGFETELTAEFLGALAREARMTLHVEVIRGANTHHMIEAVFKAVALALSMAASTTGENGVPSTKGTLTS